MSPRPYLALLLCLMATFFAGIGTARASSPGAVTLSLPSSSLVGQVVVVSGSVNHARRGTTVRIQRRAGSAWLTQKTVVTGPRGRYTARIVPPDPGTSTYRAFAPGRKGRASVASAAHYLAVLRPVAVHVSADRTEVERTRPLTLSVSTRPVQAGGTIQLQTRTTGSWSTTATTILSAAGTATFRPTVPTTGAARLRVVKPRHGYDAAATSGSVPIDVVPLRTTFGQLMHPASTHVLSSSEVSWTALSQPPAWADDTLVRWDQPGAFTPSLAPAAAGTLRSSELGHDVSDPARGAEFNTGNSSLQTADVSFVVTGSEFAIEYRTYQDSHAMVWIDGRPLSATPIAGTDTPADDPDGAGQANWIRITLPGPGPTTVRFAGPDNFVGVDYDATQPVTVTAAPVPFTLGLVSDSYFDSSLPFRTYEGSGAAVLHTKTGFRIWDLAQGGTGYLNDATGDAHSGDAGYPGHYASPFGSDARMARLADAPIDALLVNGSVNDAEFSTTAYAAAVNQFLDRVAQVRPGLPVVVVGVEPVRIPFQTHQANLTAQNDLLREITAAHSNVVGFIDPYGEQWLTGTGNTAYPKGDGNQDQFVRGEDGTHLTPAGQDYYEGLIKARLATLPSTLLP